MTVLTSAENLKIGQIASQLSYHINKKNFELLGDCPDTVAEFYKDKAGLYLKCILEEYASLPFLERVRIIKKAEYEIVKNACENKKILKIDVTVLNEKKTFWVHPYKIITDPMNMQEYLACYTREKEQPINQKKIASFSIAKLNKIEGTRKDAFLSAKDINLIEKAITNRTAPFLLGEKEEITVHLTTNGKRMYQTRLLNRPIRVLSNLTDDSSQDIYVFECSEFQAEQYFFPFGEDAEIISPLSLRNKIKERYKKAWDFYKGKA